ncbi:MAG: thioredoxin domain-containing protein [Bacteroidia bacterium]|nr:thioredoxin domain-containing protein [Bacteroidia bacterium]MBP9923605.1 thioredoxin domain-containing protein [Bacteroidia bacterium]
MKQPSTHTSNSNHLLGEKSLYLQQHANNPVDWHPWSTEIFEQAKRENKLVLISIGYSSCHWCHVMENESFVDSATAKIMNDNFICIKVDREERPDIDQIYMKAVQIMTGSGGWPLNCFTLPDGKPIYGGTYFPNATWKDLLTRLSQFYRETPAQAYKYAEELTQGIHQPEFAATLESQTAFNKDILESTVTTWKKYLDNHDGGPNRSPKFPLPNNYEFLLRYAVDTKDHELLKHVDLTLKKMAYGGIYDQIGGGFARYSTDSAWKIPHFEKMLYDNAQLISLYSKAYQVNKDPLYKQIIIETAAFLKREMSDGDGKYYSAIDADSEGEEGKFYVWTKEELNAISFPQIKNNKQQELVFDYFNINEKGYWENNNYLPIRKVDNLALAKKYDISLEEFEKYISEVKTKLYSIRARRIQPGLDQKMITSWNALVVTGLCDAYQALGDSTYLEEAIKCMNNIEANSYNSSGHLLHVESQKGKLKTGYLEDYAFTASALISLYKVTFDESRLNSVRRLTEGAIEQFQDKENGMFWFTSNLDHSLISRTKEVSDNVIPSSNSEMANVLFVLGEYFDEPKYTAFASNMLSKVSLDMPKWGSAYSNWANLMMNFTSPYKQTVISGKDAEAKRKKIASHYLPNVLLAGSVSNNSQLPILSNRFVANKTFIYVCENKTCKLPVESTAEALKLLSY